MFSEYIDFFDFSTFRPIVGRSNWSILLNILHFFVFSTFGPWREEGDAKNWPEGKIHGASVRSNIKNTVSVNLKAVCNIQYPEKTKHARTKEWTLLLLTFFFKYNRWHRNWLLQWNTRNKYWHNNIIGFVHPIEERSFNCVPNL